MAERAGQKDDVEEVFPAIAAVQGDHVILNGNSDAFRDVPRSIEKLFSCFLEGISLWTRERDSLIPLASTVQAHRQELIDSVESASWRYEIMCYGENLESFYYPDYADEDEINEIKDEILEERVREAEEEGKRAEGEGFRREDVTDDEVDCYARENEYISYECTTKRFTYKKGEGPGTCSSYGDWG